MGWGMRMPGGGYCLRGMRCACYMCGHQPPHSHLLPYLYPYLRLYHPSPVLNHHLLRRRLSKLLGSSSGLAALLLRVGRVWTVSSSLQPARQAQRTHASVTRSMR
jgi:hypothetical protein